MSLIRDAETEATIRTIAAPLFSAAGLNPDAVAIMLINDRSLNAFVSGGQQVFINSGLLIRVEHAGQLMGVIAHETGHIAGGHLARMPEAIRKASYVSLLEGLLAMGAMVAGGGASSDSRGRQTDQRSTGPAGSVALQTLFAFTRSQENAADQAGVNLLDSIGQSSRGFMEFMQILSAQEMQEASRQSPYYRTHPGATERVNFLRNHVANSRYSDVPVAPDTVARLNRVRAKLIGYLETPNSIQQRFPASDQSDNANYARTIAAFRTLNFDKAQTLIDGLLKKAPDDAYYNEIKGQMLFETGKAADAVPYYEKAVKMSNSPLLKIDLAQARLEVGTPQQIKQAQKELQDASLYERRNSKLWRLAAIAYGRDNQLGMAALASAEEAFLSFGRVEYARDHARRAMKLLPIGSPGFLRAQDIEVQAVYQIDEIRRNGPSP
jgi:predicted Zn-dependent protease